MEYSIRQLTSFFGFVSWMKIVQNPWVFRQISSRMIHFQLLLGSLTGATLGMDGLTTNHGEAGAQRLWIQISTFRFLFMIILYL